MSTYFVFFWIDASLGILNPVTLANPTRRISGQKWIHFNIVEFPMPIYYFYMALNEKVRLLPNWFQMKPDLLIRLLSQLAQMVKRILKRRQELYFALWTSLSTLAKIWTTTTKSVVRPDVDKPKANTKFDNQVQKIIPASSCLVGNQSQRRAQETAAGLKLLSCLVTEKGRYKKLFYWKITVFVWKSYTLRVGHNWSVKCSFNFSLLWFTHKLWKNLEDSLNWQSLTNHRSRWNVSDRSVAPDQKKLKFLASHKKTGEIWG